MYANASAAFRSAWKPVRSSGTGLSRHSAQHRLTTRQRQPRVARQPRPEQQEQPLPLTRGQVVLDRVQDGVRNALLDGSGREGLADRVERAHASTLDLGEAHVHAGEPERAQQAHEHQPGVPLGPRQQPGAVARGVGELLLRERVELLLDADVVAEE